jgi:tetratricopeptide (TPR) repeat protein
MKPVRAAVILVLAIGAFELKGIDSAVGMSTSAARQQRLERPNISVTPTNDKLFDEGVKKQEVEDYQGAIADFTEFLKTHPERLDAYSNRGFAKAMTNDLKGAIADFNRAIEIAPRDANVYNARGNVHAMAGNLARSIKDFNLAIEFDRNFADAYYNRGVSRHGLGDRRGAKIDINKAAQLFRKQNDLGGYQQAKEWIDKLQ